MNERPRYHSLGAASADSAPKLGPYPPALDRGEKDVKYGLLAAVLLVSAHLVLLVLDGGGNCAQCGWDQGSMVWNPNVKW